MPSERPAGESHPAAGTLRALLGSAAVDRAVLLALTLLALALLAGLLAGHTAQPAWLSAFAMLLAAGGALACGAYWSRQHQLERLREVRQQLQGLGQWLPAWQWQTDLDHRLVRLKPPQRAPASSWVQGAFSGQRLWERYDDEAHSLRGRLEAHAAIEGLRVRATQGDGRSEWTLRAMPRLDGRGRFGGYIGVLEPVAVPTTTEASDAAAADANTDCQPAASARPGHEQDDTLQALLAEQAAFSYTISHDLRAPIRVVEGFGRILKEDYGAALDRIGNDHLDRMMSAAARMNQMIDALLSLSRLSTQPLARQPVNLSQLAGWVIDDLRRAQPERVVEVQIAPDLLARGDPTLLRLVLDNLLGNAWKYTARTTAAQILFSSSVVDGQRVFEVGDNGAGFDMRFADRLFGVFQRLHSASDFQGHGVGLASVRRIVQRHGGQIWAEAEVGRGARFFFTLRD